MLRLTRMIFCCLCLIGLPQISLAAMPESLDYQGYLTDSSGSPVFGPADITVSLYNVETEGSVLWSQTTNIFINNGSFAIILEGGSGNAFPANLFDDALWLGLTVNSDQEMSPRQRLNATPFSFVAKFAETAGTANNSLSVKGLDGDALIQIFNNYDFGDGGPDNGDPREGLGDSDGDGVANFLDSDNDNDGITDSIEISLGSDINIITPFVLNIEPVGLTTDGGPIEVFLKGGHSGLESSTYTVDIAGVSLTGISATIVDASTLRLDTTLPIIPVGQNPLTVILESNGESNTFNNLQFDPIDVVITSASYLTAEGGPLEIVLDTNISSLLPYTFTVDVAAFSQAGISPVRIDASTVQLDVTLPSGQPEGPAVLTVSLDGKSAMDTEDIQIDSILLDITSVSYLSTDGGPVELFVDTNLPASLPYSFTVDIGAYSQSGITPTRIDSSTIRLNLTLPAPQPPGSTAVTITVESNGVTDTMNAFTDPPQKAVFITSSSYDGNLGGVTGANALCQLAADSAGLPGSFKAWLGDDLGNAPSLNFSQLGKFINSGLTVAIEWADLIDGDLLAPIRENEYGVQRSQSVWTYVLTNGDADSSGSNCQNWTSNSGSDIGEIGYNNRVDFFWTESSTGSCSTKLPIYCFEQ